MRGTDLSEEQKHTGPATREQLWQLWQLLLDTFISDMGNPNYELRASYLDVVRAFLRDNGMTLNGMALVDARKSLSDLSMLSLPFPNGDDEGAKH